MSFDLGECAPCPLAGCPVSPGKGQPMHVGSSVGALDLQIPGHILLLQPGVRPGRVAPRFFLCCSGSMSALLNACPLSQACPAPESGARARAGCDASAASELDLSLGHLRTHRGFYA